jgi:lipopolysaccharide/colanic/teichoic acid biosynthesis glycosyltransferase
MLQRIFDIIIVILILPLVGPFVLIISLTNLFFLGKPIFFIQKRSGLNGKQIMILKFRTMKYFNQKEKSISRYGLFLRKTKLDELPQILNIIKGDLTLVGPRPLYTEYNKLYSKKHKLRLLLKPGITGWAQVNEFDNISWKEKFDLDVWYYHNKTIFIDLLIILKTLIKIIKSFFTKNQFASKMNKFRGYKYDK